MSADRRTGFFGGTILIGSVLAISACGGGSKSNPERTTPASSKTEAATSVSVMPSETAVQEVPTATAVTSEIMTPEQVLQAGKEINGLFTQAFEGLDISAVASKIPQPSERDPQYIQNAVNICTGAAPFPYRDAAEKQRMNQDPTLMYTGISNFCGVAGETSLLFYKALVDNPAKQTQFKSINIQVENLHHSIIKGFEAKEPRITENTWLTIKAQYYPFGAASSN